MIFSDYLTYLIFLPNNDLVMTKFGPIFELFDRVDCGWVGGWVVGVSLFGRKYSQSYGKY